MANRLNWQVISGAQNITKYNIYRSIVGVESANDTPFVLSNGMTLTINVDDSGVQTVIFNDIDFVNISAATAVEIVSVLSANIIGAICHIGVSGSIYIRSTSQDGSVQITGGTANSVFGFATTKYSEKSNFIKIAEVPYQDGIVEYVDEDGSVYDWYKITAVDNMMLESVPTLEKQAGPARDPICIVFGTIQDGNGYRIPDQEIIAIIEYPPSVNGVTTSWVSLEPIRTLSLRDGTFELELLQNASYRIEIKSIQFCRVIKIPELASSNLFSMEFEEKNMNQGGETFNY